jgi:S1-C subfamily serine protease
MQDFVSKRAAFEKSVEYNLGQKSKTELVAKTNSYVLVRNETAPTDIIGYTYGSSPYRYPVRHWPKVFEEAISNYCTSIGKSAFNLIGRDAVGIVNQYSLPTIIDRHSVLGYCFTEPELNYLFYLRFKYLGDPECQTSARKCLKKISNSTTVPLPPRLDEIPSKSYFVNLIKKHQEPPPETAGGAPKRPKAKSGSIGSGSGFFISKTGQLISNAHVVRGCKRVTVGDSAKRQIPAELIATDLRNDLALLSISSLDKASANTKSLVEKLGLGIVPLASAGLLRSKDVALGEDVLVAGFPYAGLSSDAIKVTGGMVSSVVGLGDDSGKFQIDAAVQPGNSGGPIYDKSGNIVGVTVARLNKAFMAKVTGSVPENTNFAIKASIVRLFLSSNGVPAKASKKTTKVEKTDVAKIAERQTLLVICHR